jgi:hypothetical protein
MLPGDMVGKAPTSGVLVDALTTKKAINSLQGVEVLFFNAPLSLFDIRQF